MTAPRRSDGNQAEIVAALRAVGVWVWDTHELGFGFPDLVTWRDDSEGGGTYRLIEVKTPTGRLTDWEKAFIANCPGAVYVVRSVDDALRAHGMERNDDRKGE
jgi:hypothetical protein